MLEKLVMEKELKFVAFAEEVQYKLWPNDCNLIFNTTYCNIVRFNVLCVFCHPVEMCCDMLGVLDSKLTIFKLEQTTANRSQQGSHAQTRCTQKYSNMLH